ncbi:hypothetical protein [Undibacterium terreum]|uniref:Uncharacterized protein n=1 Tax=Undibacterium terreum TaxID=1224302 RepID=A0A916V287_9BURK|nr:hypothetical protein [Undibacterium terreum]GGD00099.1 hypothetical protein GCM10011396_54510 [Undibacterium terreum]
MTNQSAAQQATEASTDSHLIARINAVAVKLVFPFIAKEDIRYYLNGINIRPLPEGGVMIVATDGHRAIVVRDPNGFAEEEIIVAISKDALKHAGSAKNTLDVMSDGQSMFSGKVAEPLFIQPGNALVDGIFPRIESVMNMKGYTEGIQGSLNPRYLYDALVISKSFGDSIRFFTTKSESDALNFTLSGIGDLECFGAIMKKRDLNTGLPAWFPKKQAANTLAEV